MRCTVTLSTDTVPSARWTGTAASILETVRRYHRHAAIHGLTVRVATGGRTILERRDGAHVLTLTTTTLD